MTPGLFDGREEAVEVSGVIAAVGVAKEEPIDGRVEVLVTAPAGLAVAGAWFVNDLGPGGGGEGGGGVAAAVVHYADAREAACAQCGHHVPDGRRFVAGGEDDLDTITHGQRGGSPEHARFFPRSQSCFPAAACGFSTTAVVIGA